MKQKVIAESFQKGGFSVTIASNYPTKSDKDEVIIFIKITHTRDIRENGIWATVKQGFMEIKAESSKSMSVVENVQDIEIRLKDGNLIKSLVEIYRELVERLDSIQAKNALLATAKFDEIDTTAKSKDQQETPRNIELE